MASTVSQELIRLLVFIGFAFYQMQGRSSRSGVFRAKPALLELVFFVSRIEITKLSALFSRVDKLRWSGQHGSKHHYETIQIQYLDAGRRLLHDPPCGAC